jgi:retron-type reverse transcriptase
VKAIRFGDIETESDLAEVFGCKVDDLLKVARATDQIELYEQISLPKKGRKRRGEFRVVYKPKLQVLRLLQKNIATALSLCTVFADCVQGFTAKRSIVTNARAHLGAKILVHADIKNFFESIKLPQIEGAFQSLGCNSAISSTLAKVCSLNGFLPQGSNASPIIANMVCRNLDTDFLALATANGSVYTRYADDITFSGSKVPHEAAIWQLLRIHGFEMRAGAARTQKKGKAQYVTGLTVSDASYPRVPRRVKHRLRLELYYMRKFGIEDHLAHTGSGESQLWATNRIGGWIKFIHSVEPQRARVFADQWAEVPQKKAFDNG